MSIILDPRTKLFVLIFLGLTVVWEMSFFSEVLVLLLICFLFLSAKRKKGAIKLLLSFMVLMIIAIYLPQDNAFYMSVYTLAHVVRKFMMPLACGYYLIYSTEVSEIMATFEKMHIPNAITISIVVMLRYLPSLKEDYSNLKVAMRMRGINTGLKALRHPILSAQYILVPLLSSSAIVADELSQAAYSKGIDISGKKERYMSRKFGLIDTIIVLYVIFLIILIKGKII